MKFSQRIGKEKVKVDIQRESMDIDLRNSLWNAVKISVFDEVDNQWIDRTEFKVFFELLWHSFFKLPLDTLSMWFEETYKEIRDKYFKWEWYEVYDFIEFVANADDSVDQEGFKKFCNIILEKELSAYRFVGNEITEITDTQEIQSIEEAVEMSNQPKLAGVRAHLKEALAKLSDRKSPDYRNSIKEAISAVESISQVIADDPKAELGKALKVIEDKVGMHPALKKGFSAIYGYTSDEGGIRHAMIEDKECPFEDAKYMLVSCSTFVNYLIVKANKAGVKFK